MPNSSISSAAPCHVRIGNTYHDVVLWTIHDTGVPIPWIISSRGLEAANAIYLDSVGGVLRAGAAREAVEDGR